MIMRFFFLIALSIGFLTAFTPHTTMAADKKGKDGGVQFVELNPLILPVINDRGVTQMVSLVVALEVDSQEKADKVNHYSPRLTDAYLSDLYGSLSRKAMEAGIIPIDFVKKRLNKASQKVLGDEVVSDVLVQVLQSRRT